MDFDFLSDIELNPFALVMGAVGAVLMLLIFAYTGDKVHIDLIWKILAPIMGFVAGYMYVALTER